MPVTTPVETNYLYQIEYASTVLRYTNVAEDQTTGGEVYRFIPGGLEHTSPNFSAEPQDSEIDLFIYENNPLATLFSLGPPAYPIKLRIYEYDRVADVATPRYRGWVIRPSYNLKESIVGFHCKTVWHYYERESFTDSLSALSRYSIYDPRAGVDVEQFRVGVTIISLNDERDVLKVSGITQPDDWFKGGLIVAPDRDMRTILAHETISGDKYLTLTSAFPEFTLDTGFTADLYPGDDLTYVTWANKFASVTNNGEAFGGWIYMPNVDPAVKGVI
jgi:hypothetical protein